MGQILNEAEQHLLLEYVLNDAKLFTTVLPVLRPEFFDMPLNHVVEFVTNYYLEQHALPKADLLNAKFSIQFAVRKLAQDEFDYAVTELETHCRLAAVRNTFGECLDKYERGEIDDIDVLFRKAQSISIQKDLGTNQFVDVRERLLKMQERLDCRSSGWAKLDNVTGGIRRGELFIVASTTAGGKSIFLANIANNLARDKLNGVIISLELGEDSIAKRMDSIVSGIESNMIFENIDLVVEALAEQSAGYASIITKKLRGGANANDVRAYLMEYHLRYGYYPDVVCVDYLDIMSPVEKKSKDGAFDRDKAITEELRDVMDEFNVYGFTASQLNREGSDVTVPTNRHIAGGLSKCNTADIVIAIVAAPSEEGLDTGEREIYQLKTRNSEKHLAPFTLFLNSKNLRLTETPSTVRLPGMQNRFQGGDRLNTVKDTLKDRLRAKVLTDGKEADAK